MLSIREKVLVSVLAVLAVGGGFFLYLKARPSADVSDAPFVTEPMVASGYFHTLALRVDGTVWGWGGSLYGELGVDQDWEPLTIPEPQQIAGLSNVLKITTHQHHNLAIVSDGTADGDATDGTVWAWGGNWSDQLGNPEADYMQATPVQVTGLADVVAVATSDNASFALDRNGTVWSWGGNRNGELGTGTATITSRVTPTAVLQDVTAIAAGGSDLGEQHVLALKSDGTVWAWGGSRIVFDETQNSGQLGQGLDSNGNEILTNSASPIQVKNLSGVTAIAAGGVTSYALKADGSVWRWGYHTEVAAENEYQSVPYQIEEPTNAIALAAGPSSYALILTADGRVYTMGPNGDTGSITNEDWAGYAQVEVPNLTNITTIAAGGSVYDGSQAWAADSNGTVYAWGDNRLITGFDDDWNPVYALGRLGGACPEEKCPVSFAASAAVPGFALLDAPAPSPSPTATTATPPTISRTASDYKYSIVAGSQKVNDQAGTNVTVAAGSQVSLEIQLKNEGTTTWYRDYMNLGTVDAQDRTDRCPGFDTVSGWYKCNRARFLEDSVAPGGTATFRMVWRLPTNKISGLFVESFRPVVDEVAWLNTDVAGTRRNITWNVTTTAAPPGSISSAPPVDQNPTHYSAAIHNTQLAQTFTIAPGDTMTFTFKLKNTGDDPATSTPLDGAIWYTDYLNLGTIEDTDRNLLRDNVPGFDAGNGWYKCNRARLVAVEDTNGTTLDNDGTVEVRPGQVGVFQVDLTAPSNKILGTYPYRFRPVVDEVKWLDEVQYLSATIVVNAVAEEGM